MVMGGIMVTDGRCNGDGPIMVTRWVVYGDRGHNGDEMGGVW